MGVAGLNPSGAFFDILCFMRNLLSVLKNSKSDVDERGHRLCFFPHAASAS